MTDSLIKEIERSFKRSWDYPALSNYGSKKPYTYGEVAAAVAYIHTIFEEMGIQPGDKVALCDKNYRNWVIAMLAIITYGCVGVPILPDYSDAQLIELCEHCEAKFLFSSSRIASLWEKGKCPMGMIDLAELLDMDDESDEMRLNALNKYHERFPNGVTQSDVSYIKEDLDDMMLLSYTSGSSGHPKGVMLSYGAMLSNTKYILGNKALPEHGKELVLLPLAHMFGFATDFLSGVLKGCHLTILTKPPVPSILIQAIKDVQPDTIYSVPLVFEKLTSSAKGIPILEFIASSSVKEVIMGGAALSKDAESTLRRRHFKFSVGYGMTECGPLICHSFYPDVRQGSCGKVVPGMTVKVLSSDPQHIPGEILAKGRNVMLGYYKDEDATKEAIDSHGWLRTGDLGIIDEDGYIFIRGRKKNMILGSNGQNIYPEEAEDQVVTYSIFEECVVVQRDNKLIAKVYVSDQTLEMAGLTRETINLEQSRKAVNLHLPAYCQIAALEQRETEFEKTPKRSIKRFLYE